MGQSGREGERLGESGTEWEIEIRREWDRVGEIESRREWNRVGERESRRECDRVEERERY